MVMGWPAMVMGWPAIVMGWPATVIGTAAMVIGDAGWRLGGCGWYDFAPGMVTTCATGASVAMGAPMLLKSKLAPVAVLTAVCTNGTGVMTTLLKSSASVGVRVTV